ncbi:zinc finger protein 91-like [Vanessa atalanta]|uniref:zinc finger protein 91-like n=1 Tax=Vanessa atalanta TaxID=42275 RepID=UPI001FCDD6B6|nr:zinc finger protein 91-like [Vanessa atalanta]
MEDSPPLILCLENTNGEEVALKIEPYDTFKIFLDKAKSLLGYDVDLNAITGNQPVNLDESAYTFLLNAEQSLPDTNLDPPNYDNNPKDSDDLVYVLDDGTQIRASQIQFDNEDPLTDLTAENIPFVKYTDSPDENDINDIEIRTIKDINIVESPVANKNFSPKGNFANSLPFKLVCNNISNFEAQFAKYLESSAKMFATNSVANKNRSPRNVDDFKNDDKTLKDSNNFYTREEILNMFKDSPVTPLPCEDNQSYETRRHVRKTDPSRLVYKGWNAKPVIDLDSAIDKHDCFICCKNIESNEKLYLFDKEDQMLHRCEQRKYMTQLKIICEKCLGENFKPSRMKSPSQSLNNDEYLVIKNNQQYIFQKTTSINFNNTIYNPRKTIEVDSRSKEEFVKVEIGPDGEIITKLVDNVRVDDMTMVKDEKKGSSSDLEIIEPETEIDIENIEDEDVKEFLGKYQRDGNVDAEELKCRFCNGEFKELPEILDHCEDHKHDLDDGTVYPCPLCDYGYANIKWLKGHIKAAHGDQNQKKDEDAVEEVNNDETNAVNSSPVAKRTRSAIKRNDVEHDSGYYFKPFHIEHRTFTTEVKQECIESSDDSIWIVQTGDDDVTEQLEKLLKVKEDGRNYDELKKHKCFNCSQIFPSSESLTSHKCRKRKQKSMLKDDSGVYVPSEEDFLKRAQGKPRPLEESGDKDLLIARGRKKKNREQMDSQIMTCHNCNESFTSKVRLKFHMQFHETSNLITSDGHYACTECENVKFDTETELFDHVHFQHDKQKRWQCPVKGCGKTFFLRATLTKHSRTHTDTRRYVCVTCGKRFLDKQTLDEHGVTHLQIKPFQCHICFKQLTRRSRLRMHLRAHEEELSPALVLTCAMCCRAFRDENDAQDHANKATECIEEFTNELKEETEATEQLSPTSGIVRHAVRVVEYPRLTKGIEREVKNEQSEILLSALDDAARNIIRVVNIEKAFRCEYCEDVFYMENALNSHRIIHKGIKNPFTCHICKVSFATYSRCTTHKTTHGFYKRSTAEGRNEGTAGPASAGILGYGGFPVVKHFLCEDCGRSYLHWTYLQVHRRMKHANENYIFKCNQCEMTFPNSWSMTYHRKKIHGKSGQDDNGGFTKIIRENYRIPCRDCDAVLSNKTDLYKHRKKEHCDDSQFIDNEDNIQTTICGQCGHNLHNVTALQKHIKEVHGAAGAGGAGGAARAHACPVCARAFRSASVRDEHVRVHTGERPYPCDVCGVAFRRLTAMRNHRLIHTGVRVWACTRCPKRFRIKSDLRTHLRLKHPSHLVVIEFEGTNCNPEEITQHLALNNIAEDKVIEITMITFAKDSRNIIPNSSRALSLLSDVPRTQIVGEKLPEPTDMVHSFLQSRRGRGIAKTQKLVQQHQSQEYSLNMNADNDNLSNLNVQLLLQDSAPVNGNEMVQLQIDDRSFLG